MGKIFETPNHALELALDNAQLYNDVVDSIAWNSINIHLHDEATKARKYLLQGINGHVNAG
jgi:hypothetical protein